MISLDFGCWLHVPRFITLCQHGVLGDEKHIVSQVPCTAAFARQV